MYHTKIKIAKETKNMKKVVEFREGSEGQPMPRIIGDRPAALTYPAELTELYKVILEFVIKSLMQTDVLLHFFVLIQFGLYSSSIKALIMLY